MKIWLKKFEKRTSCALFMQLMMKTLWIVSVRIGEDQNLKFQKKKNSNLKIFEFFEHKIFEFFEVRNFRIFFEHEILIFSNLKFSKFRKILNFRIFRTCNFQNSKISFFRIKKLRIFRIFEVQNFRPLQAPLHPRSHARRAPKANRPRRQQNRPRRLFDNRPSARDHGRLQRGGKLRRMLRKNAPQHLRNVLLFSKSGFASNRAALRDRKSRFDGEMQKSTRENFQNLRSRRRRAFE